MQYKDNSVQEALSAVNSSLNFLNRQRNDGAFKLFYQSVVLEANEFTEDPVLPRQKKIPKRIDAGGSSHVYSSPGEYYRQQYYEVIDLVVAEIHRRFVQPTLALVQQMETVLIDSCNGKNTQLPSALEELYQSDLNIERLKIQLTMLPDVISTANKEFHMGIKHVTKVSTVCEVFNECKFPKSMLQEVDTLLHLYLIIPCTSVTAERSFSTLRRLKSYLRSTMSQKRLNHLVLLHTHKDSTTNFDLRLIANDFISKNNRRIQFFGK